MVHKSSVSFTISYSLTSSMNDSRSSCCNIIPFLTCPDSIEEQQLQEEKERKKRNLLNDLFFNVSLTDEQFLSELVQEIPEINLYANIHVIPYDITDGVLSDITVLFENELSDIHVLFDSKDTKDWNLEKIITIHYLLLQFIYIRHLLRDDDHYYFSSLSLTLDSFNILRNSFLSHFCNNENDFRFFILFVILNHLGRSDTIEDLVKDAKVLTSSDSSPDEYWRLFVTYYAMSSECEKENTFHHLIPSFRRLLTQEYQDLYFNYITSNSSFNLGQYIHGESVPYCIVDLHKEAMISPLLLHAGILSFFTKQSNQCFANFAVKVHDLLSRIRDPYNLCLIERAQFIGAPTEISGINEKELFTLHRIIALSRSSCELHWQKIWFVWTKLLSSDQKNALIHYLTITGFDEERAIIVKGASIIMSNIAKSAITLSELGLYKDCQFKEEQIDESFYYKDAWTFGLYSGLLRLIEIYAYVMSYKLNDINKNSKVNGGGVYVHHDSYQLSSVLVRFLPIFIEAFRESQQRKKEKRRNKKLEKLQQQSNLKDCMPSDDHEQYVLEEREFTEKGRGKKNRLKQKNIRKDN